MFFLVLVVLTEEASWTLTQLQNEDPEESWDLDQVEPFSLDELKTCVSDVEEDLDLLQTGLWSEQDLQIMRQKLFGRDHNQIKTSHSFCLGSSSGHYLNPCSKCGSGMFWPDSPPPADINYIHWIIKISMFLRRQTFPSFLSLQHN